MKFIGRKKELAKLNEEYNRSGGLVVVYGATAGHGQKNQDLLLFNEDCLLSN